MARLHLGDRDRRKVAQRTGLRGCVDVRIYLGLVLLSTAGCHCDSQLVAQGPPRLEVSPAQLVLPRTFVGYSVQTMASVANVGSAAASVEVTVTAPFSVDAHEVALPGGASAALTISLAPAAPGHITGTLRVGTLVIPVEADVLEVPICAASNVCVDSHFDINAAQCIEASRLAGTACETSCVMGVCANGTCVGRLKDCDDHDACTQDACDESTQCSHFPVVCPSAGACRVEVCDRATGCGTEPAPDGTLCGPDDCTATDVDVCLAGQCERRARPDTGRCANRWVPVSIPARDRSAMAYDPKHQRIVLFGGSSNQVLLSDTWEWDGTNWSLRTPPRSPPARSGHSMAFDEVRQRVVLFGGRSAAGTVSNDTWEWDGTTWVERTPRSSPVAREGHSLTWNGARRRLVLFGGDSGTTVTGSLRQDLWEWDGATWQERKTQDTPPPRAWHSMAFDTRLQRLTLFGGTGGTALLNDTWQWDGTNWIQLWPKTNPPTLMGAPLTNDTQHRVLVLADVNGTWTWDGTDWAQVSQSGSGLPHGAATWDDQRRRVVLFGGGAYYQSAETREWDGSTWVPHPTAPSPGQRSGQAVVWDDTQKGVLLFGGFAFNDSWLWDGRTWALRTPARSPNARAEHALAYDSIRHRVVLFGGRSGGTELADTWEWDGTSWTQRLPLTSPGGRASHGMAYDVRHHATVLFGGQDAKGDDLADTWQWDGSSWSLLSPSASPPARSGHAMVWDPVRERILLFGGSFQDTWEWDGATWTRKSPLVSPSPRHHHGLAWDSAGNRVVLFGGRSGATSLADTWEWDGNAWSDRTPSVSPPGGRGPIAYDEVRQRMVLFDGVSTWMLLP